MWVLDSATDSIISREITYVPGLYKIFDEVSGALVVDGPFFMHLSKKVSILYLDPR